MDIDGTLTGEKYSVSPEIVDAIESYARAGWDLCFVTGRSFTWAMQTLIQFNCPFYLAIQNGALILEMPAKTVLSRNYLSTSVIAELDMILDGRFPDFALYSGFEGNDLVYYRSDAMDYPLKRADVIGEKWVKLSDYEALPFSTFPAIKWIGRKEELEPLVQILTEEYDWHMPLIKDPIDPSYYILQASSSQATKGHSVDHFKGNRPLIAAGDDLNDYSMLMKADYKIVMEGAPKLLVDIADVVAPSVRKMGLIKGLDEIMKQVKK